MIDEIDSSYPVTVTRINIREDLDLARKLGIKSVPTTTLLDDSGTITNIWMGIPNRAEILQAIG